MLWYFQVARTNFIAKSVPAGSSSSMPFILPIISGRK